MPNIEIKAHFSDLRRGAEIAQALNAQRVGVDLQIDTYFKTSSGRLKLRESSLTGAQLIPYIRNDDRGPKRSDYLLLAVPEPALLKQLFSELLGIDVIVEKRREIFLVDNIRVHLDEVKGLGSFLEFEAVYEEGADVDAEQNKVLHLMETFHVSEHDLVESSYRELLLVQCN